MKLPIFLLCLTFGIAIVGAAPPPNVVLILSDDQAWGDYGFMGHEAIRTPNLDRLARQSTLFRRGYVPTALCRPSLMTLLTGQYASTHGVTGNDPSPKYAPQDSELMNQRRAQLISFRDRFQTLPQLLGKKAQLLGKKAQLLGKKAQLLGKKGYLSHQSGKLWEGSFANCGFTHGMTRGFPTPGGRHGDDGLKIGREGMEPIEQFIDLAVEQQQPFFIWYAPFLPHTPHNPPARILKKYKSPDRPISIAKYYAMCEWFDETCGQLLAMIDKKSQRENTLVVYVCDNGWIQDPDKNGYAPRSKQTPYEGGIRTPIMYSWPGKIPVADRPEVVSSIDIFPTILAATGTESPVGLPGLNLMPNMLESKPIDRQRIFGESFAHDIADLENPEASLLFRWCIEGKWKLLLTYDGEVNRYASTHPRDEKRPQLFDLIADPTEQTNLAGSHPDVVGRLAKEINGWYPVRQRKTDLTFE